MKLIDRLAAGLETLGKKANQALDEGKLRVELMKARRRMDAAARELGYLTYRQAKGTQAPQTDVEALTQRIAEAEAAAARIEAQIAQLRPQPAGGAASASPPAGPAATDAAAAPGEPPASGGVP
ncbi:MAG TPA: hypothetical protein VMF70_14375 [Gemmatimonadales bacterium]|nr:hypothetical protein [Gemmatimonadales bacterium]